MPTARPYSDAGRRFAALASGALLLLPTLSSPAAARETPPPAAEATPAPAAVRLGGDSPEAVLERARAAAQKQDFAELAACLAPADRAMVSMMMIVTTGMVVAFGGMAGELASGMGEAFAGEMTPEQQAEAEAQQKKAEEQVAALQAKLDAVLAKHGVKDLLESAPGGPPEGEDPAQAAAKLLADVDQVALIADLAAFMEENLKQAQEEGEGGAAPVNVPQGKLEGLQVTGETAAGRVDGEEIRFVKVDGRWYLAMPQQQPGE